MANKLPDINRGTTYTIQGFYEDENGDTDITGATVFFTIKTAEYDEDADDSTAVVKKDISSFPDAEGGEYAIELEPDDTDLMTPGTYYYDISIKLANGNILELDEGRVKIDGSPRNRLVA